MRIIVKPQLAREVRCLRAPVFEAGAEAMHGEAGLVERLQGVEHRVSAGDLNSGTPSESGGLGGGGRKKLAAHLRKGSGVRPGAVLGKTIPWSTANNLCFCGLFYYSSFWGNV